jgi:hypothetical protein
MKPDLLRIEAGGLNFGCLTAGPRPPFSGAAAPAAICCGWLAPERRSGRQVDEARKHSHWQAGSQPGSRPLPIIRCPRLGRQKRPRVEERVMASVPLRQDVSRLRPVGERRGYRVPDS